jgi:hypothetical protein
LDDDKILNARDFFSNNYFQIGRGVSNLDPKVKGQVKAGMNVLQINQNLSVALKVLEKLFQNSKFFLPRIEFY